MSTTGTSSRRIILGALLAVVAVTAFAAPSGINTNQAKTAAPATISLPSSSNVEGTSTAFARADHQHAITGILPVANNGAVEANDVLLYVNASTGNDANPGTVGSPLLTFDAAVAKLPLWWTKKARIHLSAGSYTTAKATVAMGGPLGDGEPLFILGTMVDSGLGTLTAGVGSTTSSIVGGSGLTVDAYRGYRLRVLTGAAAGRTMPIKYNTATGFTLQSTLNFAPASGDTFVVERPGSVITPSVTTTWSTVRRSGRNSNGFLTAPSIGLFGITLSLVGFQFVLAGSGTDAYFDSCWVDSNATNNGMLVGQLDAWIRSGPLGLSYPDTGTSTSNGGGLFLFNGLPMNTTGLVLGSTTVGSNYGGGAALLTNLIMDNQGFYLTKSTLVLVNADIRATTSIFTATFIRLLTSGTFDGLGVTGGTTGLLTLNAGSVIAAGSGSYVVKNSLGDGIYLIDGSMIGGGYGNGFGQAFPLIVTGTGNAGYGIRLGAGTRAILSPSTTVTGTLGDIIVGATSTTHANLTSATFVTDTNYLARASRL